MLKFLKNLFNFGKRRKKKNTYFEDGCEVIIDKHKGTMVIKTNKVLTDDEIIGFFKKYILEDNN